MRRVAAGGRETCLLRHSRSSGMDANEARLKEMRAEAAQSQLEVVGKELRGLMHKAGER